jgi:transcriptional regulator with GAF, ATPase, and Fis domain
MEGATTHAGPWRPTLTNQPGVFWPRPALTRFIESLWRHRDRNALLAAVAKELPQVVDGNLFRLAVRDPDAGTFDTIDRSVRRDGSPVADFEADDAFLRWAMEHHNGLVIDRVHDERRFPAAMQYFRTRSVQSLYACPLATGQRPFGCLIVGRPQPQEFGPEDAAFLSFVTSQISYAMHHVTELELLHSEIARERERAETIDASDELLRAIADVLDVRQVFPRISEIAAKVLPHDALTMTFHDGHGEVMIEAVSRDLPQPVVKLTCGNPSSVTGDSFFLIDDLASDPFPVVQPADFWTRIRADGYRSLMLVGVRARDQQLGLLFWSKQPRHFQAHDAPTARRIADHVALAVSHEQLAQAAREISEARARADRLESRVKSLADELDARTGYARIVGRSAEWQAVLKAATQVASTDTTVLLTGESGTGKEVVARFIHRASARQNGPFVAINCAALPEQLLESELFGYERGAFTGAQQAKPGQLELAAGGVLFLDEVSEMSPSAQAKFLRVLQEREFQRLGGTRVVRADVRVVAATNRDLRKAIDRKEFREDLFYRLQVFDIKIPPLRERPADILPLSEAFLQDIGRAFGRPPAGLTRDAKEALLGHRWPGNVRELRNALERAAILCEGALITARHLSLHVESEAIASNTADHLGAVERETIARVLRECKGNKSRAARRLGLTRTQLYHRLEKYQLLSR